jgi:PGF-pre-PGF domain-containing protein
MNRRFLTKTFLILLFACFFYLIFVFKSFSVLTGGTINVSLISPSDNSFVNTKSINFTFNVSWNESIVIANCILYGNFTGAWASNQPNQTEIVQGENGINITLEDGSYEWNVYCFNETEVYDLAENSFTLTVDTESPNYSLNSTDSTLAGTAVSHNLYWQDDFGLSYAIFSFDNCTGSFQNITNVSLSGNSAWTNFTVVINNTVGCTIRWCVYASDTSGNWNATSCLNPFSYITTNALPTLSYPWAFPVSNTTYEPGKNYMFNVTACDANGASDLASITFEWNGQTNYTYPDVTNVTHNSTCLNFSITLSNLPAGNYNYKWYVNDSQNEWAFLNDSYTITVVNAPSPPPSAGPGPAPPTTTVSTTPGKAVIFIPLIAAMSKANVSIQKTEGIDLTQIAISVKNKVASVQINITKLDAKPEETPALVNVYRYIRVDKKNIEDENISEVKIVFKVEKSWIASNNINPDTIALYRYTTKWEKLNTIKKGADSEYLYYEATSPGLSYFAIAGEKSIQSCPFECCISEPEYYDKPCASGYKCQNHSCVAIIAPCTEDWICTEWSECIEGKQTRICKDKNECGTTQNKPEEERSCEVEKPTFAFWLGIVLVVILIVIISKYVAKKIKPVEKPKVEEKPRKPRRQKK